MTNDPVNHPKHYTDTGIRCPECDCEIEAINITECFSFTLGNSLKYILRHSKKNGVEDLKKAIWYLQREVERLEKMKKGVEGE